MPISILTRLSALSLVLTLAACETAEPVETQPVRPHDGGVVADARVTQDVRPLPDGPSDAAGDAMGDGGTDGGDAVADAATDGPPADSSFLPPGPWYEQAMVLPARASTWVVLRTGQRVYAQKLTPGDPWTVGERLLLGEVAEGGQVLAVRSRTTQPWVVFPLEGGELHAMNLQVANVRPMPTGLHGPARLAAHGSVDTALLVGQLPEGGGVAYVALEASDIGEPEVDVVGAGLPTTVTGGLTRWVLGYASGVCVGLDGQRSYLSHWQCGIAGDDLLVGTTSGLLAVGQRGPNVVMRVAAPEYDAPPTPDGGAGADAEILDAGPEPDFEIADFDDIDDEITDEGVIDAAEPEPEVPLDPGAGEVTLVADARLARALHGMPGDRAAVLVTEEDDDAVWLVGPDSGDLERIVVTEVADQLLGVTESGGQPWLVTWNPETFAPELVEVAAPERGSPPVYESEVCGAPVMPTCGAEAGDCGGRRLCCAGGAVTNTDISTFVASGPLWIGTLVNSEVVLMQQGAAVALYDLAAPEAALAQWEGIERVLDFDANGIAAAALVEVRVVVEGEEDTFDQRLLRWNGVAATESETPCRPAYAVRVVEGDARVYCADAVASGLGSPAYPEADVRWVARGAGGVETQILVAVGDDHALRLWDDGPDGVTDTGWYAPELEALDAEARSLPIRLPVSAGGWISRVRGAELEVLVEGVGWVGVPGSAWPQLSAVSRHVDMAASVALRTEPNMGGEAPVGLYLHDLRAGSSPLGRRIAEHGSSANVRGLGLAGFATEAGEPVVYWGIGGNSTRVARYPVSCR